MGYALIDSGDGEKLERFGSVVLRRPAAQAVWKKQKKNEIWSAADGVFSREERMGWLRRPPEDEWNIDVDGLVFRLQPTDFGHLGVFPEHMACWKWAEKLLEKRPGARVLNLFAYSGGATLAAAKAGAEVVHVDASQGMVAWASENARINRLDKAPIRWIVDDAMKFLRREQKRGKSYDLVILDPPTFGRGAKGEIFKIEEAIGPLLSIIGSLMSKDALGVFFSCHTPGFTPSVLEGLLQDVWGKKGVRYEKGELFLMGPDARSLPSGAFASLENIS